MLFVLMFFLHSSQDLSEDDIKAITPSMLHGQVDAPCVDLIPHYLRLKNANASFDRILQASEAGDVNAYILCPSAVHGPGSGPVGRASLIFKLYVGAVLTAKGPVVVGEGSNRFEFVSDPDIPK